jgi:hypothetical protein
MSEESQVDPGFGADASLADVAEVVDADVEAPESIEPESEVESPSTEETDAKPDPFQDRINKLTKQFREGQRENDGLSQENKSLKERLETLEASQPVTESPKTLADFDYDESKYQEHVFAEAERRAEAAAERVAQGFVSKTQAQRQANEYDKRESDFAKTVDDFDDVAKDRYLPVSPVMADEIRGSEIGPEMLYFLGKHPEDAAEIARLPERAAIRKMVVLEGQLLDEKSKAKPNKVSDAPPPPSKTVRGVDAGLRVATTDPKSDKMSDKEWYKREAVRQAKLRGG